MTGAPIRTERLVAAPLAEADWPDFLALLLDPRVSATIGGVRPPVEVRARFDADLRHWAEHGFGQWAWRTPDGAFVGRGGLRRYRIEGGEEVVELGYSVVAERWGEGLATEIARTSVGFGFAELGLDRIHAFVFEGNAASVRVLEKCGFVPAGRMTHAGHACELYARDRDAWPDGPPTLGIMRLEVRFHAVPVEALRAFLEPLGYRFDWGPELDGIGFQWLKRPLSGTGVRATYFPDDGDGLLLIETDGGASVTDAAVQDVTARLMAERFESVSVWCATTQRSEYAGGQTAEPPAPGVDPPAWYS